MPKVSCAVIGCSNSTYRLDLWRRKFCTKHQCRHGRGRCVCDPPFVLIPFPTGKNLRDRTIWVNSINRKEVANREVKEKKGLDTVLVKHCKGHKWQPRSYDRVCSRHFVDGKPSKEHPYPTLHMGYQLEKKRKKSPTPRSPHCTRYAKLRRIALDQDNEDSTNEVLSGEESVPHMDTNGVFKLYFTSEHSYCYHRESDCQSCFDKQQQINSLIEKVVELEEMLQEEGKKNESILDAEIWQTSSVGTEDPQVD